MNNDSFNTNCSNYGIITHYMVHNHGALLQLTAMIKVLKTMGIKASALRFEKNYDFLGHETRVKYEISVRSIGIYIQYLKEKGIGKTFYNYKKSKTLRKFKEREALIGGYYTDQGYYDGIIIGSDEVFALHTGPTPVFFGYGLPVKKVFAYGGSFGPTTLEDIKKQRCINFVKGGLTEMSGVSVRDQNSFEIVKSLTGVEPKMVCDPVILYGYKQEIAELERPKLPPYILIYSYDGRFDSDDEISSIKEFAKSKNLKIVSAGFYHSWCDFNIDIDPIGLLAYFKYACFVITDTFHGCVMSIITRAKLLARAHESNYLKLLNLLDEYGLKNRLIANWEDLYIISKEEIDFEGVNQQVEIRREDSMDYLKTMLKMNVL